MSKGKSGTELTLEQAQHLLRTVLSPDVRQTQATCDLIAALDQFLAAYGVDGETDLTSRHYA